MRPVKILIVSLLLLFCAQAGSAEESTIGERFQKVGDSAVIDNQTGLMWAAGDNGKDIDWYDAQAYCKEFAAGGYTDWRLPDIKELATLYTPGSRNPYGYFTTEAIRMTDCCQWSSYETMGGSMAFSFQSGGKIPVNLGETSQMRVLPVRSLERAEKSE